MTELQLLCGCVLVDDGSSRLCSTDARRERERDADELDDLARSAGLPALTPTQRRQLDRPVT